MTVIAQHFVTLATAYDLGSVVQLVDKLKHSTK